MGQPTKNPENIDQHLKSLRDTLIKAYKCEYDDLKIEYIDKFINECKEKNITVGIIEL